MTTINLTQRSNDLIVIGCLESPSKHLNLIGRNHRLKEV